MKRTKLLQFVILIPVLFLSNNLFSQQYHPFPEEDAFWTVGEPWNNNFDLYIYTVKGDTVLNNTFYKKIYKLSKDTNNTDTVWTLHTFMRQDIANKKVYFIRHYHSETTEKLGYDFDVSIGDTVNLPAFDYQNIGDSVFVVKYPGHDSIQLYNGSYRKIYFFVSQHPGINLNPYVIEGIGSRRTAFPNLFFFDSNHQTELVCFEVDGDVIMGFPNSCGFTVNINEYPQCFKITTTPKPCNNYLFVTFHENINEEVDLQLVNLYGIIIHQKKLPYNEKEYKISTSSFPNGLYILRLKNKSNLLYTEKIIIIH